MDNKRELKRWPISSIPDIVDRNTGQLVGHLRDITTAGMMLVSRKSFDPGMILQCEVALSSAIKEGRRIIFDAKSLWCKKGSSPGFFHVGFQLLNAFPRDVETIRASTQESLSND